MASTFITKANPTANTDSRKKGTISFWFKRSKLGATQYLYTESSDGNNAGVIYISSGETLNIISYDSGSSATQLSTRRMFRDCTGWYHFHFAYDSTLGTANDRQKLWINGEQETNFSTQTNPSQNGNFWFGVGGNNYPIRIGRNHSGDYFEGYMSHFHRVDNQALAPTIFGSTDATTGEWKIKTSPSITYTGTSDFNFFILKDGNSVTDQSGQNNDLTVGGGTLTDMKDNPSNNFATLSTEIVPANSGVGSSNGGNTFGTSAAQWHTEKSHFGVSSGKWYFEVQMLNNGGGDRRFRWGFQKEEFLNVSGNNSVIGGSGQSAVAFYTGGHPSGPGGYEIAETGTTLSGSPDINVDNAIYGFALDLDNLKMYGHMSGTWFNSANPNTPTGGIDISSHVSAGDTVFPCFTTHLSTIHINFGNGYFGTTAVASAGSNASGLGIFEYDVPSGYTALCTKGLNK